MLLAAGSGSRFEGPEHKLLTSFGGRPLLCAALDAVAATSLELFVVTGAVDVDHLVPDGAAIVRNPQWAEGQATSVRAGIVAAEASGFDAVVVGLGDQPFVTTEAWEAVAAAEAPIAVATYDGARGNPVRLSSSVWPMLPVTGDAVGRDLMRSRPELVQPVPCAGQSHDVDTLEDLRRWS